MADETDKTATIPRAAAARPPGRGDGGESDGQCGGAVGIACVETAFAFGAKQVGHAYRGLAQHELEGTLLAFGTDFTHAAEGQQGEGRVFAVQVVDHDEWVEFAQDQGIEMRILATAGGLVLGVVFGWLKIHRSGSLVWYMATPALES